MQLVQVQRNKRFVSLRSFAIVLMAVLSIVSVSCSSSNKVVSKGLFQKRKYNKGFHTNLRWKKTKHQKAEKASVVDDHNVQKNRFNEVEEIPVNVPQPRAFLSMRKEKRLVSDRNHQPIVPLNEDLVDAEKIVEPAHISTPYLNKFIPPRTDEKKVNGLAVAGFVLSILGLVLLPIIGTILGTVFSATALQQIRYAPELFTRGSRGLAVAGLIIGLFGLLVLAVAIAVVLALNYDLF